MFFDPHKGNTEKIILGMLIGLVLVVPIFFPFSAVRAQIPVTDGGLNALTAKGQIETTIEKSLLGAALGSLVHAASYFARKLAYDTATYVASGGKGQGALAFRDGFGAYVEQTALDSVADGIGALGEPFGLNLCRIPDLRVNVFLQIGLRGLYAGSTGGPQPQCRWQDLKNAKIFELSAWRERYGTVEGLDQTFSSSLQVQNTDLGIGLGAIAKLDQIQAQKKESATAERLEGGGFKSLTSLISGDVLTPADVIREETKATTAKHQGEISSGQIAGIYGSGALQILPMAGSVFLNTLTSKLLQRILTEGLFPDRGKSAETGATDFFASEIRSNRAAAQNAFTFLFTAPTKQLNDYDIVAEFSSCPESPGLNNCVIEDNFKKILSQAQLGTPMTIAEAREAGHLNENWLLISPRRETENTNVRECYFDKYCYSNIQKLRKARILPLGFEIAALRSDPDTPWRLGEVIDGFEQCRRNEAGEAVFSIEYPFCHLIDPNWVIRVPAARCETQVFGPQLESTADGSRREECIDLSTCILEGESGECLGTYGYCTKEQNVWHIGGDSCPAQFGTCTTFVRGNTRELVSYLSKTVDYGECSIDTVGCRAYSLEKDQSGEWIGSVDANQDLAEIGRNQAIYFTSNVESFSDVCRADSVGCTAFYGGQQIGTSGLYAQLNGTFVQNVANVLHIKKAPAYLGCYDTNMATPAIEWPVTIPQARLAFQQNASCGTYAAACVREEIGCEGFTPARGGSTVPGIIGEANACNERCVGYETFRQEATVFSPEEFPMYFIARDADACSLEYVGCTEFTNIDAATRGGEGLEYYTDLSYCERPTGTNSKTYYSWEGSVDEGFVLRVHRLAPIDEADVRYIESLDLDRIPHDFVLGAPAYNSDSEIELKNAYEMCNERNYIVKVNNPFAPERADDDCRALYDSEGTIYYRILSNTVEISDACHPLRKTLTELFVDTDITDQLICRDKQGVWQDAVCQRCTNGGHYQNGSCIYSTVSTQGGPKSCPSTMNECRAYIGNTGDNIEVVFDDDFELASPGPEALREASRGWSPAENIQVAAEATDVGLHSLQVGVNFPFVLREMPSSTLQQSGWYELSLWARGNPQGIRIFFEQRPGGGGAQVTVGEFTYDPVINDSEPLTIGNTWQAYQLGPVELTVDGTIPLFVRFERAQLGEGQQIGSYFLDHVRLTRVQDKQYLIKDSWQTFEGFDVPLLCDTNPQDSLPGVQLGCKAYTDSKNNTRFATGFERLCRQEAIGCQPVWDTYNTVEGQRPELSHAYNVWCAGLARSTCILTVAEQELGQCTIPSGGNGCFIDEVILPEGATLGADAISPSTVIIPADTPTSTPVFLAVNKDVTCDSVERGCQDVGFENQILPDKTTTSFEHTALVVKNDPSVYDQILCRDDLIGCGEFRHGNTVSYFKDPEVTGRALCSYRPSNSGQAVYGWFMNDVGTCSNNSSQLCRDDQQCGEGNTCTDEGNVPCAQDLLRPGGLYDIWSNTSESYDGLVGTCEPQYNSCVELLDPSDTSEAHPNGHPYYVLFNDKIQNRIGECGGKASLKEGCVLFNRTDQPNKRFNAAATYEASERATERYAAVDTVTTGDLDANVLLKVDRDRECSEWLSCKSKILQKTADGETQSLCYEYRGCRGTQEGVECTDWVEPGDLASANARLTLAEYVTRPTSWYDDEYSGYSLFNTYQIKDLQYYLTLDDSQNTYLAYKASNELLGLDPAFADAGCFDSGLNQNKADWTSCGFDRAGRCFNGECLFPLSGGFPAGANGQNLAADLGYLTGTECKGFPEKTSPFSSAIDLNGGTLLVNDALDRNNARKNFNRKLSGFEQVELCQNGSCSCEYKKVSYADGTKDYWGIEDTQIPVGRCTSGDKAGYACETDQDCRVLDENNPDVVVSSGECSKVEQIGQHIGLLGYCLEYDFSRLLVGTDGKYACLTWLPIDVSASNVDIYNADINAGYNPATDASLGGRRAGGEVYCTESSGVGRFTYDQGALSIPMSAPKIYEFNGQQVVSCNTEFEVEEYNDVVTKGAGYTDFYNAFFTPDGKAQLPRSLDCASIAPRWDCANQNNGPIYVPFVGAACGESFSGINRARNPVQFVYERNFTDLISVMHLWAWKELGSNAVMLRVESGGFGNGRGDEQGRNVGRNNYYAVSPIDNDPNCGLQRDAQGNIIPCKIYHFAPMPFQDNSVGYGTVMHPPRFVSNAGGDGYSQYFYRQSDGRSSRFISPYSMAPGSHAAIYGSPFETKLRENDFSRVYFVPTGFPFGAEGVNPSLLTKDLYMDFLQLRDSNTRAIGRTIEAYPGGDGKIGFFLPTVSEPNAGFVYTYLLDSGTQNGLVSFDNYRYPGVINGNLSERPDILDDERNQIHRRYVTVFFANSPDVQRGTYPSIVNYNIQNRSVLPPNSRSNDPFSAPCVSQDDDEDSDGPDISFDNWLAIGMDFNEDGEFLGYISRWCNGADADEEGDNGIQFAVIGTMNDQCTEFAQVYNSAGNPLRDETNKAFTNRVTADSRYILHRALPDIPEINGDLYPVWAGDPMTDFSRDTSNQPFGSLPLLSDQIEDTNALLNFTFQYPEDSGIPYECEGSWLSARTISWLNPCAAFFEGRDSLYTYSRGLLQVRSTDPSLHYEQLFAKAYKVKERNDSVFNTTNNVDSSDYGINFQVPEDNEHITFNPPQVFSLNPQTCFDRGGNTASLCSAAEKNNMTINEKNGVDEDYDGDGFPDEDFNNDGEVDPQIAVGTYPVTMKFFAFANDDHMPIRRVMIDWNDGTRIINENRKGLYQNRKPFCGVDSDVKRCVMEEPISTPAVTFVPQPREHFVAGQFDTGLTCKVDSDCRFNSNALAFVSDNTVCAARDENKDYFGDTERACQEGYFEFIHTYTCSASDVALQKPWVVQVSQLSPETIALLARKGVGANDFVCRFAEETAPKVQVLDNWGWCSGTCGERIMTSQAGSDVITLTGFEGCYDGGGQFQCDRDVPNAWIPYQGEIIVIPD